MCTPMIRKTRIPIPKAIRSGAASATNRPIVFAKNQLRARNRIGHRQPERPAFFLPANGIIADHQGTERKNNSENEFQVEETKDCEHGILAEATIRGVHVSPPRNGRVSPDIICNSGNQCSQRIRWEKYVIRLQLLPVIQFLNLSKCIRFGCLILAHARFISGRSGIEREDYQNSSEPKSYGKPRRHQYVADFLFDYYF